MRLGMTRATFPAACVAHDDLHFDFLERDLVVDQTEQFERAFVRHVIASQFDPGRFAGELGMTRRHFAIEQERNVSVKLFLELMKPLVRPVPRPRLMHGQNNLAAFSVDAEKIDHGRIRHAGSIRFLLGDAIGLLILPHWAE
jgi:hypothetical protein